MHWCGIGIISLVVASLCGSCVKTECELKTSRYCGEKLIIICVYCAEGKWRLETTFSFNAISLQGYGSGFCISWGKVIAGNNKWVKIFGGIKVIGSCGEDCYF